METTVNALVPIVIDLGKTSRKKIRRLKEGRGQLAVEVAQVTEQVKANLGADAAGKEFVPVVLLYRRKPRRRRKGGGGGGLFPFLP